MFSVDHDDDDFVPAGSSKLASLFGGDQMSDDNQSLMYNAPKQPKQTTAESENQSQASSSASMAVIHAVAAFTYKYEGGKHVNLGKNGIAILGNHESSAYKLLLYKGQNQHIAFATITSSFQFVVQSNNYATFYDDQRQNWSLSFDSENGIIDFAKQVCLAKVNSLTTSLESIVTQDLREGEGEKLDSGDSVEIRYTGWLLNDHKIGEVFDSNTSEKPLRLRIHHGKCIKGIEDALIGMKKHGKRFAIVPPLLGYGTKEVTDEVLKTSTLVFEIDVKKVKFPKESGDSTRSSTPLVNELAEDKRTETRIRTLSQSSVDDSIRARGASLSEQLTQSPDRKKATIISRIVKMGQPMLPLHGAVAAAPSSESENEEEVLTVVDVPPAITSLGPDTAAKPVPRPRPQTVISVAAPAQIQQQPTPIQSHTSPQNQPVSIYQSQMAYGTTGQQPYSFAPGATQYSMYPPVQYAPQPVASPVMVGAGDSHMPLLLSETRNQNMEIRLQLGKLAEKLDHMMLKIDQPSPYNNVNYSSMDAATLSFNMQRIFKENEQLRAEVVEKNEKLQAQNEKVYELLQKNQKFMEQSTHILEQRNNSIQMNAAQSQVHLFSLEQDKVKLSTDLTEATTRLNAIQSELLESREKVQELTSLNNTLKSNIKKYHLESESCQLQLKALGETQKNLERTVQDKTSHCQELESQLERLQTSPSMTKCTSSTSIDQSILEIKQQCEVQISNLQAEIESLKKLSPKQNSPSVMIHEVKRIMNIVYKHLQKEFESEGNYSGAEVCQQLMRSIRDVTLQLMEKYANSDEQVASENNGNVTKIHHKGAISSGNKESTDVTSIAQQNVPDASVLVDTPSSALFDQKNTVEASDATIATEAFYDQSSIQIEKENGNENRQQQITESQIWTPQPPPPPIFVNDEEDDDDWLK